MSNSIVDPTDPDYCETCGGECVTGTCRQPDAETEETIQCSLGRYYRGEFRRCNRPAHHTGHHRYGERRIV
jgi:hypothetical protein